MSDISFLSSDITLRDYHPEYSHDSIHEALRQLVKELTLATVNRVLTVAPALVIGTTSAADIRINTAIDYIRGGERRTQKAAAEINVPAEASMPDDGTTRAVIVLVYIDEDDNYAALAGPIASNGENPEIPQLPLGGVQLGWVEINADAGTAYVANTTLLSAAGITDTYSNVLVPVQNMTYPLRAGNM